MGAIVRKKIYLISPPAGEKRRNYPLSLMFLHSYLIKNGIRSEVLDCDVLRWRLQDLVSYLESNKAEMVGITGYTYSRFRAYETIRAIKSRLPECKIVVGGRHFSSLAGETIKRLKEVDFVVKGEGEITLRELCEAIDTKRSFSDVHGLAFRENKNIICNPDRPLCQDIDSVHYDLKDFDDIKGKYSFISTMRRFPTNKGFSVLAGRGCPGSCVFCSLSSQRVRLRKVEKVLAEIEDLIKKTGVRNVSFGDPTLTASKKYLVELCEGILRKKLDIKWHCYSRVDVPSEIFELMKKAGCVSCDIALESASLRVLEAIKKHIKVEDVARCVEKLHELGIKSFIFAMISLPDERVEDAEMTIRFLEKYAPIIDGASLAVTQIFPDAALYGIAKERNLLPPDFNWFDDYHNDYYDRTNLRSTAPFYIEHLSPDYIQHIRGRFEKLHLERFYDTERFKSELRKSLGPFLFNWKDQTLRSKLKKVKKGMVRLGRIIKDR